MVSTVTDAASHGVSVVGVCDKDPPKGQALASRLAIRNEFDDIEDLTQYARPGAVVSRAPSPGRAASTRTPSFVGPLAAGLTLVRFGPGAAFWATAAVQMISVVPLFWTPDVKVARSAPGAFREALSGSGALNGQLEEFIAQLERDFRRGPVHEASTPR